MDQARRRTVRFVVALSAAVLLSGALIWTSFSASTEARSPSQLLAGAKPGKDRDAAPRAPALRSGALIWPSFSASTEARSPSQLLAGAKPGKTYELTGKV